MKTLYWYTDFIISQQFISLIFNYHSSYCFSHIHNPLDKRIFYFKAYVDIKEYFTNTVISLT